MKHIKLFEEFNSEELPEEDKKVLDRVVEGKYSRNDDGSYDVQGSVYFYRTSIKYKKFPVSFRNISETFDCSYSKELTSLIGAPVNVGKDFNCRNLKSLKYAPICKLLTFNYCTLIPKEEIQIIKDDLRNKWLESGLDAKEFLEKNKGLVSSKKFGF
jgi:hypothetical protein